MSPFVPKRSTFRYEWIHGKLNEQICYKKRQKIPRSLTVHEINHQPFPHNSNYDIDRNCSSSSKSINSLQTSNKSYGTEKNYLQKLPVVQNCRTSADNCYTIVNIEFQNNFHYFNGAKTPLKPPRVEYKQMNIFARSRNKYDNKTDKIDDLEKKIENTNHDDEHDHDHNNNLSICLQNETDFDSRSGLQFEKFIKDRLTNGCIDIGNEYENDSNARMDDKDNTIQSDIIYSENDDQFEIFRLNDNRELEIKNIDI
ncbi:Hypothetical protein CINCED_3A025071 [Cinara cedri]|uniref:Uncharacterized protein n=1 Tax=Cinara cedri TaxID=506608 RepID=A0A5E4MRA9_9HEMI|nr:Hypothetical protein CINCED_3A025071 [Cinara cedri]